MIFIRRGICYLSCFIILGHGLNGCNSSSQNKFDQVQELYEKPQLVKSNKNNFLFSENFIIMNDLKVLLPVGYSLYKPVSRNNDCNNSISNIWYTEIISPEKKIIICEYNKDIVKNYKSHLAQRLNFGGTSEFEEFHLKFGSDFELFNTIFNLTPRDLQNSNSKDKLKVYEIFLQEKEAYIIPYNINELLTTYIRSFVFTLRRMNGPFTQAFIFDLNGTFKGKLTVKGENAENYEYHYWEETLYKLLMGIQVKS
ncbi:hypothetical protein [Desulfosudis oleivorans]|uniref:Uncharacterized protein n=1 Tax=Desulfosudis oleivorans (strain DSM 6200 / JCM 39069 / Hxd3) TaxID=96561 RepID=A8ZTR8_DESOH|nr:hypothetical protein [Desulfosudis oleivorans]ABW67851.1 hypothetical protein Dole_2047 [Desulfosudis oleivorans Hxd3]